MVEVRFKRPFSRKFTGTDLETYGPFQVFDMANLPEGNAEVLENLGFCEVVE